MPDSIDGESPKVPERFCIALDGPAAAGKSTVASILAERLGAIVFDTGILYRAVTMAALEDGIDAGDEHALAGLAEDLDVAISPPSVEDGRLLDVVFRNRDVTWELRSAEVDKILSQVAALPAVRSALLEPQRRIGRSGRVIMAGRDIGTVVMPDADLKVYLEASIEERARRRFSEMKDSRNERSFEQVMESLLNRDRIDSERATSPLRTADDAMVIDSDNVPAEQVAEQIVSAFFERVAAKQDRVESGSKQ